MCIPSVTIFIKLSKDALEEYLRIRMYTWNEAKRAERQGMKPSGHASKKEKEKETGGCPERLDRVLSLSLSFSVSLLALFKFHAWMFRGMAIKGVEGMNTGVTIGGGKKKLFAASLGGKRKQEEASPSPHF